MHGHLRQVGILKQFSELRMELKVERREKYLISQLPVLFFYLFSTKKQEQSFKNVYQPLSLMDLDEKNKCS